MKNIIQDLSTRNRRCLLYRGTAHDYICEKEICTCPSGVYRKNCKHMKEVERMPISFDNVSEVVKQYKSSLDDLNEKFGGFLYSNDGCVSLYAKYGTGKTLFQIQESYFLSSLGVRTLLIDTEGGALSMIARWKNVFEKRFNVSSKNIFIEQKKSLESLMEYLGYKVSVVFKAADKRGEKGKLEFRVINTIDRPKIEEDIKTYDINMIMVDTVSSPIRQAFTSEQQNFPARASATALIYGKLLRLQDEKDVGLLTTHQAEYNPMDLYGTIESVKIRGGEVPMYYSKRVLFMDARDKKDLVNYRRLWIVRMEDRPKFSEVIPLKITDAGFVSSDLELDVLLTDAEKKILEMRE